MLKFELDKKGINLLKKEYFSYFFKKRIIIISIFLVLQAIASTIIYIYDKKMHILFEISITLLIIYIISVIISYDLSSKRTNALLMTNDNEHISFIINDLNDDSFQYKTSNGMVDVIIAKKDITKIIYTKTFILLLYLNRRVFFFLKNDEFLNFLSEKGII